MRHDIRHTAQRCKTVGHTVDIRLTDNTIIIRSCTINTFISHYRSLTASTTGTGTADPYTSYRTAALLPYTNKTFFIHDKPFKLYNLSSHTPFLHRQTERLTRGPPPHPSGGGGLGGYILLKIFRDVPRPNLARMCG